MGYLTRALSFLLGSMGLIGMYHAQVVEYSEVGMIISLVAIMFAGLMWEDAEKQLRV